MSDGSTDPATVINALQQPDRLWTRAEVLQRPSPVPPLPGIYGWHFTQPPAEGLPADRLLYVGIAPRHMRTRASTQHLRKRLRYHYRGNSYGSTLRLTLGCLRGLDLRRVGSGTRLTFGPAGEQALSEWMDEHARVCWLPIAQPWLIEAEAIAQLDLPLNLDQNRHNPFHEHLSRLRVEAKRRARERPILSSPTGAPSAAT